MYFAINGPGIFRVQVSNGFAKKLMIIIRPLAHTSIDGAREVMAMSLSSTVVQLKNRRIAGIEKETTLQGKIKLYMNLHKAMLSRLQTLDQRA